MTPALKIVTGYLRSKACPDSHIRSISMMHCTIYCTLHHNCRAYFAENKDYLSESTVLAEQETCLQELLHHEELSVTEVLCKSDALSVLVDTVMSERPGLNKISGARASKKLPSISVTFQMRTQCYAV